MTIECDFAMPMINTIDTRREKWRLRSENWHIHKKHGTLILIGG